MKSFNYPALNKRNEDNTTPKSGVSPLPPKTSETEENLCTQIFNPLGLAAINNGLTFEKDATLVGKYMAAFLSMAAAMGSTTLPMFTSPASPSFVKRVVKEFDLPASPGQPTQVSVMPFAAGIPLVAGASTKYTVLEQGTVDCFLKYRVVAARVTFRQVGITAINDNLGTVVDAVVAPAAISPEFLAANMLSLQLPPGKMVTLASGREGITCVLLGSPDFPPSYPNLKSFTPTRVVANEATSTTTIPAGCAVAAVPAPERASMSTSGGSSWRDVPYHIEFNPEETIIRGGAVMVQEPAGEQLFIKASPAPEGVNFRLVLELILQGPLVPSLALSIPQVTPHNTFDFGRLKYAWENVIPSVATCPNMASKVKKAMPMSSIIGVPGVAYASNVPVRDKEFRPFQSPQWKMSLKAAPTSDTPVILPEYVKQAIKFTGEDVTKLHASANSSRFARSAAAPLVSTSYQYFPMIDGKDKKAVLGIVCAVLGAVGRKKVTFDALTLESDKTTPMTIYYEPSDYNDDHEFLDNLNLVVSLVYGPWHQPVKEPLCIRMFSDYKVAGSSYMFALTAALIGCPSGGFYTGSYKFDKVGNPVAEDMAEEVIDEKLKLATPNAPLVILTPSQIGINSGIVVGGIVSALKEGKAITCCDCGEAWANMMLPFRVKSVKATPLANFTADANRYMVAEGASPVRRFIALATMDPMRRYDILTGNGQMGRRDFSRGDPNGYTTMVFKNQKMWKAKEFYSKYPNLKDEKGLFAFEWQGELYVNPYVFLGHVRQMGWPNPKEYSGLESGENQEAIRKLREIGPEELATFKEEIKRAGNPKPFTNRQTIVEIMQPVQDASPVKKAWADLSKIAKGFEPILAYLKSLTQKYNGRDTPLLGVNQGGDFLAAVEISTRVSKAGAPEIAKDPYVAYTSKMVQALGAAGAGCVAQASGWGQMKAPLNPQLTTLNNAIAFVNRNPIPEIKLEGEAKRNLDASQNMHQFHLRTNPEQYGYQQVEYEIDTRQQPQYGPNQQGYGNRGPLNVKGPGYGNVANGYGNLGNDLGGFDFDNE